MILKNIIGSSVVWTFAGLLLLSFATTFVLSDHKLSDIWVRNRNLPSAQKLPSAVLILAFSLM